MIGLFRPIDLKRETTMLVKVKTSTNMKGGVQESNGRKHHIFLSVDKRRSIVRGDTDKKCRWIHSREL